MGPQYCDHPCERKNAGIAATAPAAGQWGVRGPFPMTYR